MSIVKNKIKKGWDMATKSKKLTQRHWLDWVIAAILLLLILFFALAPHYHWWPYNKTKNLGTAFYSGITAGTSGETGVTTSSGGGSTSAGGSGSTSTTTGGQGSGSSNTGSPGGTSTTPGILSFSANVNNGDTKDQISGEAKANGLDESCALLIESSTAGKQEVCTYTQGDKVVTVTYLDDHVVSASRSGF